jgi:hypothetical protein
LKVGEVDASLAIMEACGGGGVGRIDEVWGFWKALVVR